MKGRLVSIAAGGLCAALVLANHSALAKKLAYDGAKVRQVIDQNSQAIHRCYTEARLRSPELSGELILEWEISTEGRARKFEVVESVQPDLDQCVIGLLRSSQFPSPPGSTVATVRFPFQFSLTITPEKSR